MPPSKHRCICRLPFCQGSGGEATVRVPVTNRDTWLSGLGRADLPCTTKDPRISIAHFTAENIVASIEGVGLLASVVVRPARDAKPTQSNSQMEHAAEGGPSRVLRAEAQNRRLFALWMEATSATSALGIKVRSLQDRVKELEGKKKELEGSKRARTEKSVQAPLRGVVDYRILDGLSDEAARSLCGLDGSTGLEDLYRYVNTNGVADNLVFYRGAETMAGGVKPDGTRPQQRTKKMGGLNGLFFTLFLLRTASSLRVTSVIFGVSETTGGRAFTTWLIFLRSFLRRLVRLPHEREVEANAPANFQEKGLAKVCIVIDATETRVDKVWQTDAAWATWSNYKGTSTCKVLIGITSSGAICFISQVFGGRATDEELVKESEVIDRLVERGLSGKGMHVMADRGFNSVASKLLHQKFHYVAPPSKRKDEVQYRLEDAIVTRDVANLRIHVERAIGAMKQWSILDKKFDSQQFDLIGPCYEVCGALVNLLHQPFASK